MGAQAFFYNAIFFTYALVLTDFYHVPSYQVGWYILPFALGNALGPLILGRLFDSIGRKPMIAFTYATSGVLLAGSGWLFAHHLLDAAGQTITWTVVFFFASSAAGAAYLTASEIFPVEIRALAIAFFYAAGTAVGGVGAPFLFGTLIETGSRASVFGGYLLGSGLMVLAAIVEIDLGRGRRTQTARGGRAASVVGARLTAARANLTLRLGRRTFQTYFPQNLWRRPSRHPGTWPAPVSFGNGKCLN